MDIVGRKVTHITDRNLGTGVVEACDGGVCLVRWQHGLKQFAGLSRHPRGHLSLVPKSAAPSPLTNDPLTWQRQVSNDGLQEESAWLKERISYLEEYIRELEYENFKLKSTIGDAIMSLKTQNAETKEMIYGTNSKGTITTDENFKSYVKKDEES